ncbi:MAG: nitroreductase family protein, partial [Cyanobacteria bacterium]|nr:nitroreductase family protein [Cyanobacteria bacterium GSL.Bin21]
MSDNLPQPQLSLTEAIQTRRAARAFRPDPIPDEILKVILELGLQSPSGYNLQPWRFILVKDQENKERLQACAFNQAQVAQAPVVLICCGDRAVNQTEYIEEVIQLGIEAGGVNEKYADFMRGAIPQLFEYQPCFDALEAWTNRHTMLA